MKKKKKLIIQDLLEAVRFRKKKNIIFFCQARGMQRFDNDRNYYIL